MSSQPSTRPTRKTAPAAGEEVIVAVDVETTGLDPASDRIIEVGAVKFTVRPSANGEAASQVETDGTFSSLVNPGRRLDLFITSLTGIRQADVDAAPPFADVAGGLREFIGGHAIAGHNVSFDAAFLRSHGIPTKGAAYDTHDLAFVLLTEETEYGLESLTRRFGLGHDRPHRALSDALAARDLFVMLRRRMEALDAGAIDRLRLLSANPRWPVSLLAGRVLRDLSERRRRSLTGPFGLDLAEVGKRSRPAWQGRPRRAVSADAQPLTGAVQAVFAAGGQVEQGLPHYERRPQQEEMAVAVAGAIADGGHAVIEAGTGVGKSLAYLVPAAMHAARGGGTVIISTNTINLQEQLLGKDLPVAAGVLDRLGLKDARLRAAQLKGRANYLCFRKWAHAAQEPTGSDQDARVAAKCLVWLQGTETGDRAEIGLSRDAAAFTRLSAQGAAGCPAQDGPCFLRKARLEAQGADIVVINHSLLLSDIALDGTPLSQGRGLLPPHDALIIDEAHHLEEVATRHLGFQVSEPQIGAELTAMVADRGLVTQLGQACQASQKDTARALDQAPAAVAAAITSAGRAQERLAAFFGALRSFMGSYSAAEEDATDIRVTPGVRSSPDWERLVGTWEDFDGPLCELLGALRTLVSHLETAASLNEGAQGLLLKVSTSVEVLSQARAGLKQTLGEPVGEMVYWLSARRGRQEAAAADGPGAAPMAAVRRMWVTVNGAPLRVGPLLRERLFKKERCVVLTGATLSSGPGAGHNGADRRFARLREAVGLDEAAELLLGSPFDYQSAALIVVPEDIPEPGAQGYAKAVAAAIGDVAVALKDRVLALFTSNSAVEAARRMVAPAVEPHGIRVVAQGPDGPPHRVMRALAETKACVAMGAASLWEGVDLNASVRQSRGDSTPGDASIKALIMARLPFPVPTDPIFAARSELYEDGFNEYAVPEAVLRFRQGFGRLIRSRQDRGAFIVLDRRILTKSYGVAFQRALPKCTVRRVALRELAEAVTSWNRSETA